MSRAATRHFAVLSRPGVVPALALIIGLVLIRVGIRVPT
jgi:hypothetical protein